MYIVHSKSTTYIMEAGDRLSRKYCMLTCDLVSAKCSPPPRYSSPPPPPPFSPPARTSQQAAPERPPKNTTLHANNEPAAWQHYAETLRIGSTPEQQQPVPGATPPPPNPVSSNPTNSIFHSRPERPDLKKNDAPEAVSAAEGSRRRAPLALPSEAVVPAPKQKTVGAAQSCLLSSERSRLQPSPAAGPQEPAGKKAKKTTMPETSCSSSSRNSSNSSGRPFLTVNPSYRSLSPSPPPPPRVPPPVQSAPPPQQEEEETFPPPPSSGTLKRMTSYRR